jgi:hypothetical protein
MQAVLESFQKSIELFSREALLRLCCNLKKEQLEDRAVLAEYRKSIPAMSLEYKRLEAKAEALATEKAALSKQLEHVIEQNKLLLSQHYGKHSEKISSLVGIDPDMLYDPLSEDEQNPGGSGKEKTGSGGKEGSHKDNLLRELKRLLRRLLPGESEKETDKRDFSRLHHQNTYKLDIDALDELYGAGNWEIANWHFKEFLHRIQACYYVEVRHVPVIKNRNTGKVTSLPMPGVMLSHSPVTPALLAWILYQKYFMAAPLYRQQLDMLIHGLSLSRKTTSNWVCRFADLLGVPYDYLKTVLSGYRYHQDDESTLQVLHDGRDAGTKSYVWLHRSSELDTVNPVAVYCYEPTRGTDHLRDFYKGISAFITCDAYISYDTLEKESNGTIIITGCFFHVRRRFADALKLIDLNKLSLEEALDLPELKALIMIRDIARAEDELKHLTPDERTLCRPVKVKPFVDAFFEFVHAFDLNDPLASSKLKDAIQYSINREKYLRRFLADGHIPYHNTAAERSFKGYAVGRRNWLFANTERGAHATCIIYSLVETAKLNKANPLIYLQYLLERVPDYLDITDRSKLEDLMPWSEGYKIYEADHVDEWIKTTYPSEEKPHYRPSASKEKPPKTA